MKYKDHRELVLEEFQKNVDSKILGKTTLLEIGANDGYMMGRLQALGWNYIGLDSDPKFDMIMKADMNNIPFCDNTVQLIFTSHTFEHTKDPFKTLIEFRRVLKGGGVLFMVTPYPCRRQIFEMDKTHYFVLNEMQIGRLLYLNGFIPVDIHINKNESEDEVDWHIVTIANVM
jgi:SAM-dependent methyltransferase